MDKSRINPSSDRLKPTKVTGPDKLQQYHKDANSLSKAQEYYRLQKGETPESLNHTVFKGDFTISSEIIKELTDRVNDHINQMDVYIKQQHADIKHLENIPQRNLERTNKKLLGQNLRHDFPKGLDQNRQMVDLIEQTKKDSSSLKNATGPVFNKHFLRNFQNIKGSVKQIIDHIEVNNEYIKFLENIEKKTKGLDQNRQMVDLIEQTKKDINFLDSVIKRAQLVEKFQRLESKLKKTFEDNKTLKLQNHFLERQLEKTLQENEKFRQDNRERIELKEILEKVKPGLPPAEVRETYKQLQDLHSRARHGDTISEDEHRAAFEKLLGLLCPKTLQKSERDSIEFAINPTTDASYPWIAENAEGEWRIKFPLPHTRGIRGMVLRSFDLIQEIEYHRGNRDIIPPERRVEVIASVLRANAILGPKYGFPSEGNPLAEKYQKDFEDGICKAYNEGKTRGKKIEEIKEIGHEHAYDKLRESIKPPDGIPGIFPSLQPGGYFEESSIWEIFEGQQQPVELESPEFDKLREELKRRKQNGENHALTANILWNETTKSTEFWVQPYYIMKGLMSRHPMNAQGRHSIWSGEIHPDPETMAVACLKDQSGHYMTYDKNDPGRMAEFALKELKKRGCETSDTMIVLTAVEGPTTLEYENYKLPSRDSGKPTKSEEYIKTKDSRPVSSLGSFLRWSPRDFG